MNIKNLESYHHIDAEEELTRLLTQEIARETIKEVLALGSDKNQGQIDAYDFEYTASMHDYELNIQLRHYISARNNLRRAQEALSQIIYFTLSKIKNKYCEGE